MSNSTVEDKDRWRIRALAKSVSTVLRQKFGSQQFYTAEQVDVACDDCRAPDAVREYAVAMFVEPEQAGGVLQKLGSSKTALELRKFFATQIFFISLPDVSADAFAIDFHSAGDSTGGGSDGWGGGSDGGSDGGGDGGGGGGD